MEMTFPHHALRQDSASDRKDYRMLLAAAIARQANSRTVRALSRAGLALPVDGNDADQRVHYFAGRHGSKTWVRGAFWQNTGGDTNSEPNVYQAGSTNIKVRLLEHHLTGEQFNHPGHGASRKS